MASKTDTSTEGRSDPAAARLRKVAAKVRQVSTSPPNDVIVFGRLIKEAHDAGAWPEGTVIGDRLRRALTAPGSDNLRRYADETVPAWVLQAYEAVLGEFISGLALPSAPEEVGKWEAEILAAEIEREADRIEAEAVADGQPSKSDAPNDPIEAIRNSQAYRILTDPERRVFDEIIDNGPKTGKELCNSCGIIDESSIRAHIIPKLKKSFPIKNRKTMGYYLDVDNSAQ
jgi:hypothetical protein